MEYIYSFSYRKIHSSNIDITQWNDLLKKSENGVKKESKFKEGQRKRLIKTNGKVNKLENQKQQKSSR